MNLLVFYRRTREGKTVGFMPETLRPDGKGLTIHGPGQFRVVDYSEALKDTYRLTVSQSIKFHLAIDHHEEISSFLEPGVQRTRLVHFVATPARIRSLLRSQHVQQSSGTA